MKYLGYICCVIEDPAGGNCQLTGKVSYVHQILGNPDGETGLYLVSLSLNMNSRLCHLTTRFDIPWTIQGTSEDEFYVSEEGIYILYKPYTINNRPDILLVVVYLLTTEGVGIPSLYLVEIDDIRLNDLQKVAAK